MALIEAASYPYLKNHDRRKVNKKYDRILRRYTSPPPKSKIEQSWDYLRKRGHDMLAKKRAREEGK